MAPSSDYASTPSTGRLKLKGVKDSKVDKKKKKKRPQEDDAATQNAEPDFKDNSVILKKLEEEDADMTKEKRREVAIMDGKEIAPGSGVGADEELGERIKTEAERRYEEQRRRRVCQPRGPCFASYGSKELS